MSLFPVDSSSEEEYVPPAVEGGLEYHRIQHGIVIGAGSLDKSMLGLQLEAAPVLPGADPWVPRLEGIGNG